MGKKFNFDYIIIGSGPAGTKAGLTLAKKTKKRIAIVEDRFLGGTNIHTRDIPYAIGLGFSHAFYTVKNRPEINGRELHYNFPTVITHQFQVVSDLYKDQKQALEKASITYLSGRAHFIDNHTIAIDDKQYTAAEFILATGSKLKTGGIYGLESVKFFTPETAMKIRRLPKFVLVVGAGSTGCEIAEYFAELGSKVILMEQADRILPKEDKEVSSTITDFFVNELGMMIVPKAKVVALEQDETSKRVIFNTDRQEKVVRVDCIVLATGAKPETDYGLENAGVKYKESGITVNKFFQTSTRNIYAVGDCLGGESSTERCEYQASILVSNLLNKSKNFTNYSGYIRLTNTYPEIATVGMNEIDLTKKKRKYKKSIIYLNELPASKIKGLNYGFVKILVDHSKHVLGATIVAPNAGLMAEEFSIALRHKLSILEIASTPHITNSWNNAIKLAAKKLV